MVHNQLRDILCKKEKTSSPGTAEYFKVKPEGGTCIVKLPQFKDLPLLKNFMIQEILWFEKFHDLKKFHDLQNSMNYKSNTMVYKIYSVVYNANLMIYKIASICKILNSMI